MLPGSVSSPQSLWEGGGRGEGGRLQVRSSTLSLQCTLTVLVVHSHDESCEEVLSSENALLRGFQQK